MTSCSVGELTQIIEKKFKTNEGLFYGRLERSLMEIGVERQAYQGGTFVYNHVHTLLKVHK